MKEKIKPMAIGAGIGAAGLAGVAFLMKKPTKGMLMLAGLGLVLGAAAGYFISSKGEEKSGAAGLKKGDKVTIGGKVYVVTAYGSLKEV